MKMRVLTLSAIVASGGVPPGRFALASELIKVEHELDANGEPTGAVLVSAFAQNGCREWARIVAPAPN